MSMNSHEPTFNLKAVVRETGLKPDTLRAWERRYGLPQPKRTSGGHRLYSKRDIETLKWLVARQEEGLSISRAIDMWQALLTEGRDPLAATQSPTATTSAAAYAVGNTMSELRQAWVSACLSFDEQQAENVLAQTFALYPLENVCSDLLQKGMVHIGEMWHQGKVTVQQEHFASGLAMRRLEALIAATPPPTRAGRIMVGCPPEENHTFIPLLLTLLLRRQGWEVLYLGANVPLDSFGETLQKAKPDLVVFSAQSIYTAATLTDMARLMQKEGALFAYGGSIFNFFPKMRPRVPGYFLGERLDVAISEVKRLLSEEEAEVAPAGTEVSKAYRQALTDYRQHQAPIEAEVWQTIHATNITHAQLANANNNMGRSINAALIMGDINYLGSRLSWIDGLFVEYPLNKAQLRRYIKAYHRAAENALGEQNPVVAWLAQLAYDESEPNEV